MVAELAALTTAAGVLVLLSGVIRAVLRPAAAAATLAAAFLLALEFLLAAGLLRLSHTATFTGLATTAAIVLTRTLVSRGLRPLAVARGTPSGP